MSELIFAWVIAITLWVLVALQIADYQRRKKVSAAIQELQELIKRWQK